MKKTKYTSTKKILIVSLIVAAGLLSVFAFYKYQSDQKDSETATDQTQESIKLAAATEEEKQQAEDNKKNLPDNPETTPPSDESPSLKQVSITITSSDANPVRAQVVGVAEDDGTCTATFTSGPTILICS